MKFVAIVAIVLGASSAAAFSVAGQGRPRMRAPARAPAPQLGVRTFISRRLVDPFRRDKDAEKEVLTGESLVGADSELKVPAPVADLDQKKLSAVDSLLVRFGVKTADECVLPEEGEDLMEQIKCAGRAGIISYILWEWAFWIGAGGLACFAYFQAAGGWPDLSNPDDQAKVGASAFALVNVARFAVPLRIGLALGTTPWVDDNIVQPFLGKDDTAKDVEGDGS
eukprot:CAMPEP_0119057678 /NCGR_PEP_ID=MMETSP1178-20130426/2088_1 /TAXON_ID=33656 /ORGANISM="unid sp, Strain CCMP2000" /LENGTH=223 /DNA_ID=CAMNT_0007038533 /DNA_START=13 /DNA_END=684 /DNA_ORIENTATION=-